jgi:DNA invertase Pin-like site-specific DNA recombinase
MRAFIYTRVSLDRDGTKASPQTQEAEARQLCAQRGWEVIGVFTDRNASAFKRGVKRPEFDRMLEGLEAGEADMVVAYKLDRLTRGGMVGVADLLGRLEAAGAGLTTVHDNIDTSTPIGQGVLGIIASLARQESLNTAIRVASANERAAKAGKMHQGGCRQFGYQRDGAVEENEAAVVRDVAARLLAGESLRSVANDLNKRGIPTTTGGQWRSEALGQMLKSPRLVGLRVYKDKTFPGSWEPVLDQGTWTDLQTRLSRHAAAKRTVEAHLLTGLLFCGKCGGRLKTMGMRLKDGRPYPRYQCVRQPGDSNCGGVAIAKDSTDLYVTGRLLSFLAKTALKPLDEATQHRAILEREVEADEEALVALTQARYVERSLTDEEFRPAREALHSRLEANRRQLALLGDIAVDRLRPGSSVDLVDWWDGLTLVEQRAVLRANILRVAVLPAAHRGGNKYDTDRVRIDWAGELINRVLEQEEGLAVDEGGNRYELAVIPAG